MELFCAGAGKGVRNEELFWTDHRPPSLPGCLGGGRGMNKVELGRKQGERKVF